MNPLGIIGWIKNVVSSIGWKCFIWGLGWSEDYYFNHIYETESARREDELGTSSNISRDEICADTIETQCICDYCRNGHLGINCPTIKEDRIDCFVGRKLRPC